MPVSTPGKVVRAHRKRISYSQETLAEKTGVTVEKILGIEEDKIEIDTPLRIKIGDTLGIDPEFLRKES
jgi:DNA-binding XRE family transcriptional regulator